MLKQLVSGIILASAVLLLSIPAQAGPRPGSRAHVQRPTHHRPGPHIDRHARQHQRQHVKHDRHHPRHHRHHLHVHSAYCPVVVERHVYHHYVETAPVWEVEHHAAHAPTAETRLYIVVAPPHGEVYIDGNYVGEARTFRHGKKLVPVPPGHHTVQLQYGGQSYTQQVTVEPGATAVVKAKRM